MTEEEALAEIAALVKEDKVQFRVVRDGYWPAAVRDEAGRCPLCSLAHARDQTYVKKLDWINAGNRLGVPFPHALAFGADSRNASWRGKVLLACGVAEEKTEYAEVTPA